MAKIPADTEILLSHGPPYGILDLTKGGVKAGCHGLLKRVSEVKPLVCQFGHIHETYGWMRQNGTLFINASTCNIFYKSDNPVWVLDLPKKV